MSKRIFPLWALVIAGICSTVVGVTAQTTDADVEESERRKIIAQNNKDVAEAEQAEFDARFPKPDRDALVGSTSVKGDFIESKMLGYCAMKTAAGEISETIVKHTLANSRFVIYSEQDVKMLSRYQLMLQRLRILKKGYEDLTRVARVAGGPSKSFGPGLIANKVLDYLSLLKTDIDLTGTEFDINEREVVAEVFKNLPGRELYYPQRIPLSFRAGLDVESSDIFKELAALGAAFDDARQVDAADVPKRDRLDVLYYSTMKELGLGDKPAQPAPTDPAPAACPATSCTQTTNVSVGVGVKEEAQGGAATSDKTFFSYLQAETLLKTMTSGTSYWLDVAVVKAGGNMRVKSNFITNFMFGSRVNFSGGAIVYFHVFDHQGVSKLSGVVPAYENYRKSSSIGPTCE